MSRPLRRVGMLTPIARDRAFAVLFLVAAVIAHAVSAYQLSRRDIRARPSKYVHKKARASYATRTMRWGGIILALFIVWHILDLTRQGRTTGPRRSVARACMGL